MESREKINKIFSHFDKLIAEEEQKFQPPKCHFTFMSHEASDYEEWWECRHCGHTKNIGFMDRRI